MIFLSTGLILRTVELSFRNYAKNRGAMKRVKMISFLICGAFIPAFSSLFFSLMVRSETGQDQSRFHVTSQVAQLIRNGQEAMYNCDYSSADRDFDAILRLYPTHPVGYMYKAECVWWQCLADKSNKELQSRFLQYTAGGIERGESLVSKDSNDFYAQMFLAGLYGNQTRFFVTISHSYLAAMRSGMKGDKYNRNALAIRPDCFDCRIGTGTSFYAPEALPPILRQMAMVVGFRGNKTQSIKDLEEAVQKGEFAQTEARIILLGIYYNEKWFDKYESLMSLLIRHYPSNNILLRWFSAYYIDQHRAEEGIRFFSSLLEESPRNAKVMARGYALLEKGRLELDRRMAREAVASLTQGIEALRDDKACLAQAHLAKGFALDLLNQRAAALQEYQAVLGLPNIEETRKQASQYMKRSYQGKP
jgi:hypothetical protein